LQCAELVEVSEAELRLPKGAVLSKVEGLLELCRVRCTERTTEQKHIKSIFR